MKNIFDDLVACYKAINVAFQELKPVTLAQWILESGRGTSELATNHLNFAGLKWRSEMVGYAVPVQYEAHDGIDFYCKFDTLEGFIVGYWKFISRAPYKGWEAKAKEGPEAFIKFIGPIYNPGGPAYVEQILALINEATRRLDEAPVITASLAAPPIAGTKVVIVIDPGHGGTVAVGGSSPNNAKSPSGELEKDWTLDLAKRTRVAVLSKAITVAKNIEVILTRENDINKGLSVRAGIAKEKGAKLFLSIHFNGFNKKVRGAETLVDELSNVNRNEDLALARTVQSELIKALLEIDPSAENLPGYDRGVKEQALGVLRDIALGNSVALHPCSACLVEIEFMDVPAVEKLFRLNAQDIEAATKAEMNRQRVAEALAEALLAHA